MAGQHKNYYEEAMANVKNIEAGSGPCKLKLNPVVFTTAFLLVLAFTIACIVSPDYMLKGMTVAGFDWVIECWTWIYIFSQDFWILILMYILIVGKYGNLKMGRDDEEPLYSWTTWFSMLFCCGIGVGLIYWGTAEPLYHYKYGSRFHPSSKKYGTEDELATHSIMVVYYHWGLHGWIPYTTMGAILGLMSYRRGFPMTARYCFYPLLGDKVYGLFGDAVDILSIITTLFGVCTSLGLGTMQINAGLQRLNHGFYRGINYAIPDDTKYGMRAESATLLANSGAKCAGTGDFCKDGFESYGIQTNVGTQLIIIACITSVSCMSVMSGMNVGIVNLSRFTFCFGTMLLTIVLFMGETYFQLNVCVQALGYYLWYLPKIGFQTDAFEQLGAKDLGNGGSPDGLGDLSGPTWMSYWTMFYWGWWISWAPFTGTFLAKISRGRTLREFIIATLIVPTLYSILWFGCFGAEGIRTYRIAKAAGLCDTTAACMAPPEPNMASSSCGAYGASFSLATKKDTVPPIGFNPSCVLDSGYHAGYGKCDEFKWTRKVAVGDVCTETTSWKTVPCGATADPTALDEASITGVKWAQNPCAGEIGPADVLTSSASRMFNLYNANLPDCFVPVDDSTVCLYHGSVNDVLFDQLSTFGPRGFTDFLCVIAMAVLIVYFVSSSDSGSLVIDIMCSNGDENPSLWSRALWSLTEGATAAALLYSGKNLPDSTGSLKALRNASLFTGLPYTFILFWCCQALVMACKEECGEISIDRPAFSAFIFNLQRPVRLAINFVAPGPSIGKIISQVGGWPLTDKANIAVIFWGVVFQLWYVVTIVVLFCAAALEQWCIISFCMGLVFVTFLALLRNQTRKKLNIQHGDMATDMQCSFFWPFAITQMEMQWEQGPAAKVANAGAEGIAFVDAPAREVVRV